MTDKKQEFLSILSSTKPEDITDLIFKNSKIKPVRNVVIRIKGFSNSK